MRLPLPNRWSACFAVWLATSLAVPSVSQAQRSITLHPQMPSGTTSLVYDLNWHVEISQSGGGGSNSAQSDTLATAQITVSNVDNQRGTYEAEMRFTKFDSTAAAQDPALKASMEEQAVSRAKAALSMSPVRVRVEPGDQIETLSRTPGGDYDQPVQILIEMIRNDVLPAGPTSVGAHWTRQRAQPVPTMPVDMLLYLDCQLSAIDEHANPPVITVAVASHGDVAPPSTSIPGYDDYMHSGFVPSGDLKRVSDSTEIYRINEGVLQSSESHTELDFLIQLKGAQPVPDIQIANKALLKIQLTSMSPVATP